MGKQSLSIQELVNKIERGEIRLPEMQRQYVWPGTRVRDLLDSLYRSYPSGTILTWETDEACNGGKITECKRSKLRYFASAKWLSCEAVFQ